MKKRVDKKAQSTMSLPFGLIFSIILIIVFIVVAFIVVKNFLDTGRCAKIGFFYDDFEKKVNEIWRGAGSDVIFKIDLPSGVKKICFANMSAQITNNLDMKEIRNYNPDSSVFLLPNSASCGMSQKNIGHLNLAEITKTKNPYCISANSEIRLTKGIYDSSIMITSI